MKFHRNSIWLIPLLLIITFPVWSHPIGKFLTPRGGFDPEVKKAPKKSHDFKMDKVKITQNQRGKKTALIKADRAKTGDSPEIFLMENVNADIYDENGNITKIIARTGKYNTVSNRLTLMDNVVVNKTADKQFLYSDLLHYDSQNRTVHSPGATRLVAENASIDGGSLHYDIKTQTYEITKRVQCEITGFIEP